MDFRFAKMVSPLIQEASSFLKKDAITFISPVTSLRLNIMSSRDRDLFYPLLISAINLSQSKDPLLAHITSVCIHIQESVLLLTHTVHTHTDTQPKASIQILSKLKREYLG